MTAAVVSIVLLLVGLPLLAFWLGGRRSWSRLRPGRGADPWGDLVRAHGLSAGEAAAVSTAVARGRRLDDERLRRAAVAHARQALSGLQWREATRGQRVLLVLVAVWLLLQVVGIAVRLVAGEPEDVSWGVVAVLAVAVGATVVFRRRLHRAVALNSGPPA
ncbi:hypothetical protein SAMN05660657_01494 [Geodermatophilus amargosae]|uniref:Uncharacterized protein n=1 Tax=Geodermatophilus amargosae TaxID=1296565 RepID=A0A1I6YYH4_9ACTN|nr:hypothetical protein [Geodermatophilus amargosae]SFT55553.1 hypothetical protein SAMN05660657_01494 [Geodermatophilus amargosae]